MFKKIHSWVYTQENWKHMSTKSLYTNIHRSNIHNSAKVKTTQCPWTDEWKNKTRCIYTMEYYLAIERNEVLIHKDKPSKYNAK